MNNTRAQKAPRSLRKGLKRYLVLFGYVVTLCATSTVFGQVRPGSYEARFYLTDSFTEYTLEVKEDHTFSFHFYRKNFCEMCKEINQFGKGTWKRKGSDLLLLANEITDVDETFMLNLNDSKARIIKRRGPNDQQKEVLSFYASSIYWVKGLELTRTK
ncbi:hypothetical protein [Altibacter sp. HG106]|uniref:hypothetical protein n=1 Tax=Altibacter sp. HG106 TaxID=3023937 RepID=UPI0023510205|nr:hypothetical protein [Altibacter sp. HG106]MDC7995645.1 hypothetical protein [Altibacter sp. HG106]